MNRLLSLLAQIVDVTFVAFILTLLLSNGVLDSNAWVLFARLAIVLDINIFGGLLMTFVPGFQFPLWVLGVIILEWFSVISIVFEKKIKEKVDEVKKNGL